MSYSAWDFKMTCENTRKSVQTNTLLGLGSLAACSLSISYLASSSTTGAPLASFLVYTPALKTLLAACFGRGRLPLQTRRWKKYVSPKRRLNSANYMALCPQIFCFTSKFLFTASMSDTFVKTVLLTQIRRGMKAKIVYFITARNLHYPRHLSAICKKCTLGTCVSSQKLIMDLYQIWYSLYTIQIMALILVHIGLITPTL
jgi:hypothetical protein